MTRLRHGASLVRGTGFPPDQQGLAAGDLPFFKVGDFNRLGNETYLTTCENWISNATAVALRARPVPRDAVLFPKIGAALMLGARRITTRPSVFDNNVLGVVPTEIEPRYLRYWLATVDLAPLANPGPVPSLDDDALRDLRVPVAVQRLQVAIADYLDAETSRSDASIASLTKSLALLGDRRTAVISQAVAPAVGDAGRWQRTRLKYLAAIPITNGVGEPGTFDNPEWPRYVRTTDIAGPRSLRRDVFASLPPEIAAKAMLRRGDIVMTAAGATVGKSLLFDSDEAACYAGYLVRFRARPGVDTNFISYWTESTLFADQIAAGKVVSTIENFSAGRYQNLVLTVPDLPTQRAVVSYLDRAISHIDALAASRRLQVDLLLERRRALILAAVTGRLDIPGAAA